MLNAYFMLLFRRDQSPLVIMLRLLLHLGSSHMAIVQKPVSVAGMDPYYEITGVVTLEDVFEEMIGSEIIDETDKFVDNTGRHRANRHRKMDFKVFINQPTSTMFPPQLKLACFQYLHSG